MSDADDLERLRERKRQELIEAVEDGEGDSGGSAGDSGSGGTTPTDQSSTPEAPIHVDGRDHLEETVQEHPVVLLEFYADWCGPCEMLEPVLDELAATTDAAVAKVDVDTHQGLASQYGVRGVPTIVVFDDGAVAEQMTGARDQDTLETLIERYTG